MDFLVTGLVIAAIVAGVARWLYSRGSARESPTIPVAGPPHRGETDVVARPVETGHEAAVQAVEHREHYYVALRHQALHRSRAELGLVKPSKPTKPWGVLMETSFENAHVTVLALSDGNASIYLSTGGGFIGGMGHQSIRQAAVNMVRVAGTLGPQMTPTKTFPLPERGRTIFYVLTDAGVRTGSATDDELRQQRHALAPLFFAGQGVITQYRLLSEKK